MSWADDEVGSAELGDPRRTRRCVRLMEQLAERPGGSLGQACGNWAATKAVYRWLANPQVDCRAVQAAHFAATRERVVREPLVLLVQDTTSLDFTHQRHTTGLCTHSPLPTGRMAERAQHPGGVGVGGAPGAAGPAGVGARSGRAPPAAPPTPAGAVVRSPSADDPA